MLWPTNQRGLSQGVRVRTDEGTEIVGVAVEGVDRGTSARRQPVPLLVVGENAQAPAKQVPDQVAVQADVVVVAVYNDRRTLDGARRLKPLHGKALAAVFEPAEGLPEIKIEEAAVTRPETVARQECALSPQRRKRSPTSGSRERNASSAGKVLPSRNSRNAPPPVDR